MNLIKIYITKTYNGIFYHCIRWYSSDVEILGDPNILNSIYDY
jgi:hypothetical protein